MQIASPFIEALQGRLVAHVWRGYGSAIFLEFGALTERKRRDEKAGHPHGEVTLMIEWSWRIERPRSILGGSWSSERRWPSMFKRLIGREVAQVEFPGALPEISLSLSNGLRVTSFMTAEGQPSWAVISRRPNLGSLSVKRGKLNVEPPSP
ncbi:MAG: hypothetical protein AB9M53_02690 [Leptothrix sp. (in: b-proteobacteria)]